MEAVREIILAAAAAGKQIHICGVHASNELLMAYVYSLPLENRFLPSWSVVNPEIPKVKAFLRALNRPELIKRIGGRHSLQDIAELEKLVDEVRKRRSSELQKHPQYQETMYRTSVQGGPNRAIRAGFDQRPGLLRLMWVNVDPKTGGSISFEEAGLLAFDFSFMIPGAARAAY